METSPLWELPVILEDPISLLLHYNGSLEYHRVQELNKDLGWFFLPQICLGLNKNIIDG
jgi:hypothetical protein